MNTAERCKEEYYQNKQILIEKEYHIVINAMSGNSAYITFDNAHGYLVTVLDYQENVTRLIDEGFIVNRDGDSRLYYISFPGVEYFLPFNVKSMTKDTEVKKDVPWWKFW